MSTSTEDPDRVARERRPRIKDKLNSIATFVGELFDRIDGDPDLVQALTDSELLAADARAEGAYEIVSAECERRRTEHEQQARRFASRGQAELVPVLAERART